jgi:hypothetical protein
MYKKLLILALFTATDLFAQRSLHLPVGDPARKDKEAKLVLDAITATASGELLTPRDAVARLAGTRLVFIGESHTSIDFHRIQLRVIEELQLAGKRSSSGWRCIPTRNRNSWMTGAAACLQKAGSFSFRAGTKTGATTGTITETFSSSPGIMACACLR